MRLAHPGGFIRHEIIEPLGLSMDTLMRMQNNCDIVQTRKRAGLVSYLRTFPGGEFPRNRKPSRDVGL